MPKVKQLPRTYTVVGLYADNNQPWVQHTTASTPKKAALKAIKELSDSAGTDPSDIFVVEVFEGTFAGILGNDSTFSKETFSKTIFS